MGRIPERIVRGDLVIRRWRLSDAVPLATSVAESLDHLRPWMPWAAAEPLPPEERNAIMARWERSWETGEERAFGLFLGRKVVGGCGLVYRSPTEPAGPGATAAPAPAAAAPGAAAHPRPAAPGTLEIGYWVHVDHLGKGYATTAAEALTDVAFRHAGAQRVEIHHDVANVASGRVPAKLGFRVVGDEPREVTAPGEVGTKRVWRTTRGEWARRRRHP